MQHKSVNIQRRRLLLGAAVAPLMPLISTMAISKVAKAEPVRLGMVVPLTGRFATYGTSAVPGAQFATKLVNEHGGIKSLGGAQLELLLADSKQDVKVSLAATKRLLLDEKVAGIVGPFSSSDALAVNPLSDVYKTPFISPFWTSIKAFELHSRYSRTINLLSESYGETAVKFLRHLKETRSLSVSKVALVYDNSEYGLGVAKSVKEAIKHVDVDLVLDLPVSGSLTSYTPALLRAKQSKADVVMAGFYFQQAVSLLRAIDLLDYRVPLIGLASGFSDSELPRALGKEVAQRVFEKTPLFGVTTGMRQIENYEPLEDFLISAKKADVPVPGRENSLDIHWYGLGAQAILAFKLAFEHAKSRNGVKVNDAIVEMNLPRGDKNLLAPYYMPGLTWTAYGKPQNQAPAIAQWQEGRSVLVYPDYMAGAAVRV